jgi:purine-binding chemotaxis protein CheW
MIEPSSSTRGETIARGAERPARSSHTMLAIFRLGGEFLAVDSSAMQEITFMARLSIPSGLPVVIAGFLNLAQRPIPVLRLHRLLGLPESKPGLHTQILILRDGGESPVGWMIDSVVQIIPVRQEEMLPVPENHCFRDCAKALFTVNDTSVFVLAPERVILEQERHCILEFQAREEERIRALEYTES